MLATIFWAMAVRNFAPRLLGKAFWFTFVRLGSLIVTYSFLFNQIDIITYIKNTSI